MAKKGISLIVAGLFALSAQAGINVNWINADGDGLWSNKKNWKPIRPTAEETVYIGNSSTDPVVVDYDDAACGVMRFINSPSVIVKEGGTLSFKLMLGGYKTAGKSTVTVDGGTLTSGKTENPSGTVRLGAIEGAHTELNIVGGGVLYTYQINASYNATGTGKINLLDGTIELWKPGGSVLALDADGTMEIGAKGKLILAGKNTALVRGYISKKYLYGTDNANLEVTYNDDEDKTFVTPFPGTGKPTAERLAAIKTPTQPAAAPLKTVVAENPSAPVDAQKGLLAVKKTSAPATKSGWQMGDPIVTYWAGAMPMTDAAAKQLADGGWNLAWVSWRGQEEGVRMVDHFIAQLDILQRYGIRGIITLGEFLSRDEKAPQTLDDPVKTAELNAIIDGVKNHPAMYAYTYRDEPSAKLFPNIARIKAYTEARDPAHLVYVNLYPMNINGSRLGVDGEPGLEAGRQYLKQFIDTCQPKFLCYDHYHFTVRGDGIDYFLNLKLMREASLYAQVPFMNIVQASSWTPNMRIPTGEEMRWLAYTSLAYGAQGISHYVYSHPGHDGGMAYLNNFEAGDGKAGIVTVGEPTPLYYYMCKLNREFFAVAKALQPLKSLAVHHVGIIPKGATVLPEDSPFQFHPPVPEEEFPAESIEKLSKAELAARFAEGGETGSQLKGFVIGLFGKEETPTHALVVNLDYRTWSGRAHKRRDEFINPVRRALTGPGRLEFFDPDTSEWMDAKEKFVFLKLPPGGGLLVRVAE